MQKLPAEIYCGLTDKTNESAVTDCLGKIRAAEPTTITPEVRNELIVTILGDLRPDVGGAIWRSWKPETVRSALESIKVLGRNPVGSEALSTTKYLSIVAFHAGLLFPPSLLSQSQDIAVQKQAIAIIANALRLFDSAMEACNELAIGEAAIDFLAGGSLERVDVTSPEADQGSLGKESLFSAPRLTFADSHMGLESGAANGLDGEAIFLLGRVLMLLTSTSKSTKGRKSFVKKFVEDKKGVEVLVLYLHRLPQIQSSYMALSELLKTAYHILVFFPELDGGKWDDRLDSLLPPLLHLLRSLPQDELLAPLTNVINCLTRLPFSPSTQSTWLAIPDSPSDSLYNSVSRSPPSPKLRSLYTKLATNPFTSPGKNGGSGALRTPSPISSPPRRSSEGSSTTTTTPSPSVPSRVMAVLETFIYRNLPPYPSWLPDDPVPRGYPQWSIDEILPPSLLLLTHLASGAQSYKEEIKSHLIPIDLDRSPESQPLEKRSTFLGMLLRFLRSSTYPVTQMSIGELFWTICDMDATKLSTEIGYGNAAGLLFNKGIPAPLAPAQTQSAHIEEIPDAEDRNLITALKPDPTSRSYSTDDMTQEEKEREAEKIMNYFERMERNPAMQMLQNPMKEAVASGKADEFDRKEAEEEIRRLKLQDEADEEEALRDLAAYKARKTGQ